MSNIGSGIYQKAGSVFFKESEQAPTTDSHGNQIVSQEGEYDGGVINR